NNVHRGARITAALSPNKIPGHRGDLLCAPDAACRRKHAVHVSLVTGRNMFYRFAEFTLDGDTRQLLCKGEKVHVTPKAFQLLQLLLANRARAMSKIELQQQIWPSTYVE